MGFCTLDTSFYFTQINALVDAVAILSSRQRTVVLAKRLVNEMTCQQNVGSELVVSKLVCQQNDQLL